ncbi:MAG: hypothetical protein EBT42_07765 [Actinobacteria bacterium]|nr:hypothetical protein [Actinomycetota bacterium]
MVFTLLNAGGKFGLTPFKSNGLLLVVLVSTPEFETSRRLVKFWSLRVSTTNFGPSFMSPLGTVALTCGVLLSAVTSNF